MQNQIPDNWQETRLGDLLEGVVDNRGKTPPLSSSGYPMIEVYNLSRDSKYPKLNCDSKQKYVSADTYDRWFRDGHPQAGDILVSTVGTIAQWSLVPQNSNYCIAQNVVALRPDSTRIIPEFLRSYFNQRSFVGQVQGIAIGATQPSVKLPHFLDLKLIIPPYPEQKKIASFLSSIDDKIEVNNKIAKTLEDMSQTIFKEWFVNFRFPGYENIEFVDSELGKIPNEWEVVNLGDIVTFEYGRALKEENRKEGTVMVVGSSGIVGNHNEKFVSGPGIVVGRKGTVGSVLWIDEDFYPIDTTFYIKSDLNLYYCFYLLKRQHFISGDSAVPGLNRNQAYSNQVIRPNKILADQFQQIVSPFFEKRAEIKKENQKLATVRDLLLPKLMKGEIRV